MSKIYSPYEVMEILKDELPTCFKRGSQRIPLAVGIKESVLQHYAGDERFNEKILKLAIKLAIGLYCRSKKYLAALVEDASRIDINGQSVGRVTHAEAQYAKEILARREKAKEKENAPLPEVPEIQKL